MNITQYQTNEIAITLPVTEFVDSTFNAIRFPSLEASLVISRGVMPEGTTVESIIDDQIQKLGAQVRDLHFSMRQSVKTGAGQTLPALEMQSRFARGNETVHQYQLAFVVPATRLLMVMTYSRPKALTQADTTHWEMIKNGLTPLQRI